MKLIIVDHHNPERTSWNNTLDFVQIPDEAYHKHKHEFIDQVWLGTTFSFDYLDTLLSPCVCKSIGEYVTNFGIKYWYDYAVKQKDLKVLFTDYYTNEAEKQDNQCNIAMSGYVHWICKHFSGLNIVGWTNPYW